MENPHFNRGREIREDRQLPLAGSRRKEPRYADVLCQQEYIGGMITPKHPRKVGCGRAQHNMAVTAM